MWGYLLGGVSLFAALFLEQAPAEWLHGPLRGGPPGGPVPVDIPSPPYWQQDDKAVLEAVPEAAPFPASSVAFEMDFQIKVPLLDEEGDQGLSLLAFDVLLNSVLFIWRPPRVPQKRRFGRLICITC